MVDRVEKEVEELDIENSVQDMEDILERFLFLIKIKIVGRKKLKAKFSLKLEHSHLHICC